VRYKRVTGEGKVRREKTAWAFYAVAKEEKAFIRKTAKGYGSRARKVEEIETFMSEWTTRWGVSRDGILKATNLRKIEPEVLRGKKKRPWGMDKIGNCKDESREREFQRAFNQ